MLCRFLHHNQGGKLSEVHPALIKPEKRQYRPHCWSDSALKNIKLFLKSLKNGWGIAPVDGWMITRAWLFIPLLEIVQERFRDGLQKFTYVLGIAWVLLKFEMVLEWLGMV